jgi:protein phosphatase
MSEQPTAESPAVTHEGLVVQAVLRTDVGLVRSENQDFGTYTTPSEEREAHPGGRLLVVADGMGGHRGGATASRLAGETVKAQYLGSEGTDIETALRDALARANSRVYHEAQANPDLKGMGTTTSALVVRDANAWFGHVGDSRIYLVRGNEIRQLTDDHSLVATMVREGLLTKAEAETHPRRNVLQRSIGVSEQVEIDVRGPYPIEEGDVFILCSDGLHGVVKEDEIREIARKPLRDAADEFIKTAIERGAPDNVTVIVAHVVRASEIGEDTLVEGEMRLEETQRSDVITAPIPAVTDDDGEPEAASPAAAEDTAPTLRAMPPPPEVASAAPESAPPPAQPRPLQAVTENERAAATAKTLETERPASGAWKWILLVIVILGAAGAWLVWNTVHH